MTWEEIKHVNTADVFRDSVLVGKISRIDRGSAFEYDTNYLEGADRGGGIAFHLPHLRRRHETSGVNLHTYFAGLLPEGLRLRALTKRMKTSEDDLLSLLIATGGDCIGDVSVVPENQQPSKKAVPTVEVKNLRKVVFAELFERSIDYDATQSPEPESSIPGVQEKISAATISFPVKTKKTHGSFILKLNPPDKPRLVENEDFFLRMARACGLEVPNAKLVRDRENNTGILIERFDRILVPKDRTTLKVHQEDACQFLNRYPSEKYRIKCSEIAEGLAEFCSSSSVETSRFIRLLAFSYLIGNGDLHAKNVSVQVKPDTNVVTMTPAYDLLTTLPYGDSRMALQFEGRSDNFKRAYFVDFGERYGVNRAMTQSILDEVCSQSQCWVDRVGEIGLAAKKTAQLKSLMRKRLLDLR